MEFLIALLKHPFILVLLLMFIMGFVGMTYEFILRLCGRNQFLNPLPTEDSDDEEPPETANVPKPPTPPNNTLKAAEEIPDGAEEVEDEDGNVTVEYTYDGNKDQDWWNNTAYTNKEGTH